MRPAGRGAGLARRGGPRRGGLGAGSIRSGAGASLMAGYRIRELREARGLSRADLARAMGLKTATLVFMEDGYFLPRAVDIPALAAILGVKPEELLDRSAQR